uniref:30S ribosomal protein S8 n=1 Tax=Trachydiscus minutus TaxID=1032745 RepID=A0A0D3M5P5_9STRA|nr:30S ribosomal protein S8 [Trachydiscus minutus]AIB04117.1 30S ribosomal protein S8 [Trachydiscus minutus]
MVNDTISDMLTRIRNGNLVNHKVVKVDYTRLNYMLTRLLKAEGFIRGYETVKKENQKYIFLYLKYYSTNPKRPVIRGIQRVSKPGLRIYVNKNQIPTIFGNQGIAILSTSQGILTSLQAKELGVGGEVICYVW